jgi:16S rRNA G966 N2-methylase RsmD
MDWFKDDGINIPMITDQVRNQFYNTILQNVVTGQDCIDIGFGTGLLSVIALTHGARQVTAFEKDYKRYCLGKEILKKAGLEHKVNLINEQYHTGYTDSASVKFCEIVSENLWSENLWSCLPRVPDKNFHPGCYFLEIIDIALPTDFLFSWEDPYTPGINLPKDYVDAVQSMIALDVKKQDYINYNKQRLQYPDLFQILLVRNNNVHRTNVGGYIVDVGDGTINYTKLENIISFEQIDFDAQNISFKIEVDPATAHILTPRVGMISNGNKLYLDSANSWGLAPGSRVVGKNNTHLTVEHNLYDGNIKFFGVTNVR